MIFLRHLFLSSLGRKYLMAVSGGALLVFAVGHMLGNLQVFLGPEALNAYGHFLQSTPELLWPVRLGLLAMVLLHGWAAVVLTLENRAARPVPYAQRELVAASYASRTMIWSGVIVAVFVVYHLLHYTARVQAVNLAGQDFSAFSYTLKHGVVCRDVFRMVIAGFSQPTVSVFYLIGVGLLCWHLSHGIGALFQSLGLKNRAWQSLIDRLGVAVSALLFAGYAAVPVAVLLGYGREALK
jgi:succinate dehydrogenase / fumarate reductase cytochrome b subunit